MGFEWSWCMSVGWRVVVNGCWVDLVISECLEELVYIWVLGGVGVYDCKVELVHMSVSWSLCKLVLGEVGWRCFIWVLSGAGLKVLRGVVENGCWVELLQMGVGCGVGVYDCLLGLVSVYECWVLVPEFEWGKPRGRLLAKFCLISNEREALR